MLRSRLAQSTLAITVLLLGGFLAWSWATRPVPLAPAPTVDLGPVPVVLEALEGRDFTARVQAYGSLLPARRTALTLEVGGRLVEVAPGWREGARIDSGATLLRVEELPYRLEEERAEALLAEARAALRSAEVEALQASRNLEKAAEALELSRREEGRRSGLFESGVASSGEWDAARQALITSELAQRAAESREEAARAATGSAQARVAQAEAALAIAADRTARTRLQAPFQGRLVGRSPAVGRLVSPGEFLGELYDVTHLELVLRVAEEELPGIAVGARAEVRLPSRPDLVLEGNVAALGAQADERTRTVPVEIDITGFDEDPLLVAGLFAHASVETDRFEDAIVIDRTHFAWRAGRPVAFVWNAERRVAERRELVFDRGVGEGFLVESGLVPGEVIITSPLERLRDGTACRPLEQP